MWSPWFQCSADTRFCVWGVAVCWSERVCFLSLSCFVGASMWYVGVGSVVLRCCFGLFWCLQQ